jgi:hypothetical protein
LIVSFKTVALQKACLVLELAEEQFGAVHAQALIALLAEIEAFGTAAELIDFLDAPVALNDSLSLPIGSDYRATFTATGARYGRDDEGRVVWSSVTRLKLMQITGC